jgi:hypothetical protein
MKSKIPEDPYDYIIKHQLFEKYFNNLSNFNSNNSTYKESFNTFQKRGSDKFDLINRSPVYALENTILQNNIRRRSSIDFLMGRVLADDTSNISHCEFANDNFSSLNCYNTFDFSDKNELIENGLLSNNLSTNFFSKFPKNENEKI